MKMLRKIYNWLVALFVGPMDIRNLDRIIKKAEHDGRSRGIYAIDKKTRYLNVNTSNNGKRIVLGNISGHHFSDLIYVYYNGQLLLNQEEKVDNADEVKKDVALWRYKRNRLVFSFDLEPGSVVQVMDVRAKKER